MAASILLGSLVVLNIMLPFTVAQRTQLGFYSKTRPNAEELVRSVVQKSFLKDKSMPAGLLRLHFHDCFARGCDASVLIDSTEDNIAEKDVVPNLTLRGFDLIDETKALLESRYKGIVSCSDILALATRDAVAMSGGPEYPVPTRRRDGLVSKIDNVNIPGPTFSIDAALSAFESVGLNLTDLVTFLGTKRTVTCFASYLVCTSIFNSIMALAGNINYYDVQKECNGGLCYDFSNMENYLNQGSVRDALGVGSRKFVSCSPLVYEAMLTDWMRNMEVGIPTLLEDGVKLLVYAGEYDLICNWLGNSRWVNSMDWSGSENFKKAPTKSFLVDNKEVGLITNYGPLSFLKVHDAGHMVPMDQPKAALEMLKRWTQGSITDDNSQILKTVTEMPEKNFES